MGTEHLAQIIVITSSIGARNVKTGCAETAVAKSFSASAFRLPEKRSDIFRNMCLEF